VAARQDPGNAVRGNCGDGDGTTREQRVVSPGRRDGSAGTPRPTSRARRRSPRCAAAGG